jgi:hypothetical protein
VFAIPVLPGLVEEKVFAVTETTAKVLAANINYGMIERSCFGFDERINLHATVLDLTPLDCVIHPILLET